MKNPHFFKVRSRIGLINNPSKQKRANIGVEEGSDYILEESFLKTLKSHSVSSFSFPNPEDLSRENFYKTLEKNILLFQNLINREIEDGQTQIVIGGDHSVSLPSVLAVIDRVENSKKVGYVHFDSHGDINLHKDSPSKNFHGMYLRPLFDDFDVLEIDSLLIDKMPTENLLMIGNLDLDKGEFEFLDNKNIKTISRENLLKDGKKVLKNFSDFIASFKYLHVSFDGDVLDKSIFNATGIPCEKGFMLEEIMLLIDLLSKHKNLSFDIAEFNPYKKKALESKEICQEILLKVLDG
ncbi:MAG: arginase family protein [Candidatus Levybacteria bacterium]|nr:arginase family protein [Candidatus Levybacteria bacterium]